jgi:hypothetical protein
MVFKTSKFHPLTFKTTSSNLRDLQYNPVEETLAVRFNKSEKVYMYRGVDIITVTKLLDSVNKSGKSLGKSFNELIKDADFSFDVVDR